MEWEQSSKALVGIGTLIILAFSVFIVIFMVNLKRRLNAKQHFIDILDKKSLGEVEKLKVRVDQLEKEIEQLKKDKADKNDSPPNPN